VKGLVRLHNGDMDIRSRLGEGTRVTVRLPLTSAGVRPAGDVVKLVIDPVTEPTAVAQLPVKKSA